MVERFYGWMLVKPGWVLFVYLLILMAALSQFPKLKLDASSDSLLLQGDPDLARREAAHEGQDDARARL